MVDEQIRVETWENIAKYFPYSVHTVRKKFGREMFNLSIIFKSHKGRSKKPVVWGYPSMLMGYVREKDRLKQL